MFDLGKSQKHFILYFLQHKPFEASAGHYFDDIASNNIIAYYNF